MTDIRVDDLGSIMQLTGETQEGLDWMLGQLATEPWQWSGASLSVEPRMGRDIVSLAREDNLIVKGDR